VEAVPAVVTTRGVGCNATSKELGSELRVRSFKHDVIFRDLDAGSPYPLWRFTALVDLLRFSRIERAKTELSTGRDRGSNAENSDAASVNGRLHFCEDVVSDI
jgi:hypothetical protein